MAEQIKLTGIIAPSFYELHKDVQRHKHTHYVLEGGRGSTKSTFVACEIILLLLKHPNLHALVFRKVGNTLRDSVYERCSWVIDKMGLTDYFTFKISPMEITYKPTGQKIMFRGLDKAGKLKSLAASFGYIGITHFEERDQYDGREEIREVLQSTMRGGDIFWNFETNNPPISRSNWANIDSLKPYPDRIVHHSTYLTVPKEWLGQRFFDEAQALKDTNDRAYRHEYLGEVTGTGGNVFENLVLEHISDERIKSFDTTYFGQDWGWYPDPNAFNRMYFHTASRTLYIYDERRRNKCPDADWAKLIEPYKDEKITADPGGGGDRSIAWFNANGYTMRRARKGPGSVDYSMKWLQSLNAIVVDPDRCPNTASEFSQYEYDRTKEGEIISGYPDKDNHHIDAVRYALERVWRRRGQ